MVNHSLLKRVGINLGNNTTMSLLNQGWKLSVDATGRQYIYNEKLGCSRWLWERYYDENTKHFYLCNVLTGQTVWEAPTSLQTPLVQTSLHPTQSTNTVSNQQAAFSVLPKQQRNIAVNAADQKHTIVATNNIQGSNETIFYTPDGRKYYWDPVTRTSRWADESIEKNEPTNIADSRKAKEVSNVNNKKTTLQWKQNPKYATTFQPMATFQQISKADVEQKMITPQVQIKQVMEDKTETSKDLNNVNNLRNIIPQFSTSISDNLSSISHMKTMNDEGNCNVALKSVGNTNDNEDTNLIKLTKRKKRNGKKEAVALYQAAEPVVTKADSSYRIIGKSVSLEKPYLRLTSVPDPEDVRPYSILKKALRYVKNKYKKGKWSYNYTCEQLKSIRQDMTVQGIEDALAVDVYETHARLALENDDLEEFNQCQTRLSQLYEEVDSKHYIEFVSYRILYAVYLNSKELLSATFSELTSDDRSLPEIIHAVLVWKVVAVNNWIKFFKLYEDCPHLGFRLMDKLKTRVRQRALGPLKKAFRVDNLDIEFLSKSLGFRNFEECRNFFLENGFELDKEKNAIVMSTNLSK